MGIFIDPRKNDGAQRMFCRVCDHEARGAGRLVDPPRSGIRSQSHLRFLLVTHVTLFEPFVLYATVPQFFRGLELEAHFRIPVYGWMMKRFGNVPVPDTNRASVWT